METREWKSRARGVALLCVVAVLAGGVASAQTLGPSYEQLEALVAGDPDEPIALARFLRSDESAPFARYLAELEQDVRARGGVRVYGGAIDPGLAAPLRWDHLVIDAFPSRRAAVESLRALDPVVVSLGLEDSFVIALRPWGDATRLAAGALAWVFRTLLPLESDEPPPLTETQQDVRGSSEVSPDPVRLRAFTQSDPDAGFAMLNLNQFRDRASHPPDAGEDPEQTGEGAYRRYSLVAMPQILRRGGRLLFAAEPIGTLIGAEGDPLDRPWQQLVLVYYPTRRALGAMVADPDFRAAARYREAALERAAVLATTPWPEFAPAAE